MNVQTLHEGVTSLSLFSGLSLLHRTVRACKKENKVGKTVFATAYQFLVF